MNGGTQALAGDEARAMAFEHTPAQQSASLGVFDETWAALAIPEIAFGDPVQEMRNEAVLAWPVDIDD